MATFFPNSYSRVVNFSKDSKGKVLSFGSIWNDYHIKLHVGCENVSSQVQKCSAIIPIFAHGVAADSRVYAESLSGKITDQQLHWSPSLSSALYRIDQWGSPYFSVNSSGNVTVRPFGDATLPYQEIDLMKVVKMASELKSNGELDLQLPLVIHLPDVLKNRLESLHSAFDIAIQHHGYGSHYQGVYPVKCNQERFVVEDVVKFGYAFRFGLEAGSKPELLLAMSHLCKGNPEALLICNGIKDAEFISLALMARKLNLNTVIVLEQEEEIDSVIDLSRKLSIKPMIGIRAKLRTKHSGHFGSTSGETGKFGLTTTQILQVVKKLQAVGMMDCLQLLHFHIGSQIPSTSLLSDGVIEAAQIYCELVRLGANMQIIDIGGGLGIDYDGSKSTNSENSIGYSLEEYASTVILAVQSVCDSKQVKNPVICSESGRALVSHHSVLIFEAISASVNSSNYPSVTSLNYIVNELPDEAQWIYQHLIASAMKGEHDSCSIYTDKLKQCSLNQFKKGFLGLEQLASIDNLCKLILNSFSQTQTNPVSTYHVNLSIFNSIPDYWAIGQLFPIIPIHRLHQRPEVRGILFDLTGDSDGRIDKFIGGDSSLPLHEPDGTGYYLGMFLGGAYEEVLGGLHNLFGRPSVVRVSQGGGAHNFIVTRVLSGQSCRDVLRAVQYEPELMVQALVSRAEECFCCEEGGKIDSAIFADLVSRAFNSMPYLVSRSSDRCDYGFIAHPLDFAGDDVSVTGDMKDY